MIIVYSVKIQDRESKLFLNSQEIFTKQGRTFATLGNAKVSVSGKLKLNRIKHGWEPMVLEYGWWKQSILKYIEADFIIYTDNGQLIEPVLDYIYEYLGNDNQGIVEYIKNVMQNKKECV